MFGSIDLIHFPTRAHSILIYWKYRWQDRVCETSTDTLCSALKWLGNIGHLCWSQLFALQSPHSLCRQPVLHQKSSGEPPTSHLVLMMVQEPWLEWSIELHYSSLSLSLLANSKRDELVHMWSLGFNYISYWFLIGTSRNAGKICKLPSKTLQSWIFHQW